MNNCETLKLMYRLIVFCARRKIYISYGELAQVAGCEWKNEWRNIYGYVGRLVQICGDNNWPALSAVVCTKEHVSSGTIEGKTRDGLVSQAKDCGYLVDDPANFVKDQQKQIFEWAPSAPNDLPDELICD